MSCCNQAGWLVVTMPYAADWTMGISAKTVQWPNEAYRITDTTFLKHVPPALADAADDLYDAPDASLNFLLGHALSQTDRFEQIKIKDPERIEFYAPHAADAGSPTLADLLRFVPHDGANSFEEFPVAVRPLYDFLEELKTATEVPVLLVIDGWNRFHQMASSTQWDTSTPLHAQKLMVPRLLSDLDGFGGQMANGLMLCGITRSSARPFKVPKRMRKHVKPPLDFSKIDTLPTAVQKGLRHVGPFSLTETQRALEFYSYAGCLQNAGLEASLRTGDLGRKVHMMTGGIGCDVFKLCEQM